MARALKMFKWNRALGFEFSIQSSVYGATTAVKVSLFSTWTQSTVSFYSVKRRNRPVIAVSTKFLYLGLVNVSIITGTCCS